MTSAFNPAHDQLSDPQSDPQLISLVRGGDTDAFGLLYERHLESARRLARVLSPDQADADDLIADTFAKVLAVLRNGGGPDTAFRAYLLTTMRHTRYDRARRERRVELTDDLTRYETPEPADDPTISRLETSYAARAFNRLPERWRAVLWHTEVEGESPAQVAPLLGLTPNGVAALAYRARERLRQMYLQEHIALTGNPRCHWTGSHLAGYVRAALAKRDRGKVDEHLSGCAECRRLHRELTEENAGIRGVIAPLLLGAAAPGYLAGAGKLALGGWLAGAWGALVLWWPQVAEHALDRLAVLAGPPAAAARRLGAGTRQLIQRYGIANLAAGTGAGVAALAGIAVFLGMTAAPPAPAPRAIPVPAPAAPAAPPVYVPPAPSPVLTSGRPSPPGPTRPVFAPLPPVVAPPVPPPAAVAPPPAAPPVAPPVAPPAEPAPEVAAPEFTELDLVAGRPGTLPIPVRAPTGDDRSATNGAAGTADDVAARPVTAPERFVAHPMAHAADRALPTTAGPADRTALTTAGPAGQTTPTTAGPAGGTVAASVGPTPGAAASPSPQGSPTTAAAPPGAVRLEVTLPAGMRLAGAGAGDGWHCAATADGAVCDRPRWGRGARSVARLPVLADAAVSGFQEIGVAATYGRRRSATAFRVPVAPSGLGLGHAASGRVDVALAGNTLLSCLPRPLCLRTGDNNVLPMAPLLPGLGEPAPPDGLFGADGPAGPKGPIEALAGPKAAGGARLALPDGAKVRWAGLVVAASAQRVPDLVALHGPQGAWLAVDVSHGHAESGSALTQGFADVTRLVRKGGGGDWWLAAPAAPLPLGRGQFAGWTLAVVYEHGDAPRGEAAVYLGPRSGRGDEPTTVGLGGGGPVRVDLALWDGDLALHGDELLVDGVVAGEPGNLAAGRNAGAAALACRTVPAPCLWRTPGLDVLSVSAKAAAGGVAQLRTGGDPFEVGVLAVVTGPARAGGADAAAR